MEFGATREMFLTPCRSFIGCNGGYELTGDWGRVAIKGEAVDVIVEY